MSLYSGIHSYWCMLLLDWTLGYARWSPSPPLDSIRVMVIVWRLRGNIIRTALCWIVWHNVHSQQHTYVSSSYRSNKLGLSHWDPYAVRRGGCLELYYCNMVEWFWWDSSLMSTTNWSLSVLWHCWFGHLVCKYRLWNDLLCVEWDVKPCTLTMPGDGALLGCCSRLQRTNVHHRQTDWDRITANNVNICWFVLGLVILCFMYFLFVIYVYLPRMTVI